jgi:hypothetical protein
MDRHRAAQQPLPGDLGTSGEVFGNPAGSPGKSCGYFCVTGVSFFGIAPLGWWVSVGRKQEEMPPFLEPDFEQAEAVVFDERGLLVERVKD